jgi:hypothetical protein
LRLLLAANLHHFIMKRLLFLVALFIASDKPLSAADRFLKATVSGTVQTQTLITNTNARIHTTILNNRRIFQEFLVSPADYELVVNVLAGSEVVLLPKRTSSMLPTLFIFKLGSHSQGVVNTKLGVLRIVADITPGAATNLFKNLVGEMDCTVQFRPPLASAEITKFSFNVIGHGTDPAGVSTSAALLKFKVIAVGEFIQKP